jgi:large subunit ribosomal protein L4
MKIDVVSMEGKKVGELELADAVFGTAVKELPPVGGGQGPAGGQARRHPRHQDPRVRARRRQEALQAEGDRQRPPGLDPGAHFVGGGKVFGPHPRDYAYTVPKKVKRAALASALSLRASENKLVVVDKLAFDKPTTKKLAGMLKTLGLKSALVVDGKQNGNLTKSGKNLPQSKTLAPEGLNVYDILNHPALVIAKDAVKAVEARIVGAEAEESAA